VAHAVVFEAGVLALAIALGWVVSVDPFAGLAFRLDHLGIGLAATVPPVVALWLLQRSTAPAVLEFRRVVEELVEPLFADAPMTHMVVLALMAGVGEEALFRGVVQGGLTDLMGWLPALLIASALFGVVHWLTGLYAFLAGVVALHLGGLYLLTGNLLVPIVVHALYDVVALVYLRKAERAPVSE
jgi:membrane protease YdiL (CAAX protease family)